MNTEYYTEKKYYSNVLSILMYIVYVSTTGFVSGKFSAVFGTVTYMTYM